MRNARYSASFSRTERQNSTSTSDPPVEAGGGVDVEHPHRLGTVVAERVDDAGRDEDEGSGRRPDRLVAQQECHRALEDVERVVLGRVLVGLELAAREDLDDAEVEARRVGGAGEELDVPVAGALSRRDDDGAVHAADRMVHA